MAFVALETGLKTDGFSGVPGGTPELRERTSGRVTVLFQRAGLLPGGTPELRGRTTGRVTVVFQRAELLPGGNRELRERTSGRVTGRFQGAGKQHSYRYHPSVLRLKSSRR